ncbi:MAG TPA: hypothetical protein VFN75_10030 [Pseudonocardiaceae bacterium]|nr:hypothetical protein [Pseudonocardiaceae bacterium]
MTAVVESAARWVLLTDGWVHLLTDDRPGGVLMARCGHSLSRLSISPPFTWEAIMESEMVDEVISMLELARGETKKVLPPAG